MPREHPTLVLIAGQSGVGKTTAQKKILSQLGEGTVSLDGDDWVVRHPHYDDLAGADDRTAHLLVDDDASYCSARAREEVRANRFDVLISYPFGDPGWARGLIEPFREAGYRVEAVFVAEADPVSAIGIIARYQQMRDEAESPPRHGRWVTPQDHDSGYRGVVATADYLEASDLVDEVTVVRRDGRVAYANARDAEGRWAREPRAGAAIEDERARRWSPEQSAVFLETVAGLQNIHREPEPLAPDLLPLVRAAAARATHLLADTESQRPGRAAITAALARAKERIERPSRPPSPHSAEPAGDATAARRARDRHREGPSSRGGRQGPSL